jgi:hypothetical protein
MEGTVWDPSGNPLSGALLTAVQENTGIQSEAMSDAEGSYRFLVLQPGIYTVTAKAKGFKDVIHRGILLFNPGSTVENFSFEVSAIDRTIPPTEHTRLLDSDTAASFSRRDMEAVPLLNRDPLELLVYEPGVQINGGNEGVSTVNGTRQAMNTLRMDGISITDPVNPVLGSSQLLTSPDSVSDLQAIISGSPAEYGRSGGGQFMLISRPGTKSWSGNVYDYFRNKRLDANEFFNNASNIPKPGFARNLFGATASGNVGSKNLVFLNFEGNVTDRQVIKNPIVLTSTAKTGVFQWYVPNDTTRDSTTIQSFDIVANDPRGLGIDPTVASQIAKLPDPNNFVVGDGLNTGGFLFDSPAYIHQERVAARVDRSLSAQHQLFLRFNWDNTDATDVVNNAEAPLPGEPSGTYAASDWGFVVGSDYTFSQDKINELRVGYLRPKTDFNRPAKMAGPMLLANSWTNPLDPSFPRSFKSPAFEITDNFSHGKNLHSLKYGFTFRRILQGSIDYSGVYPNIIFGTDHGNAPPSSIGPSEQSVISSTDRQTFENLYNDLLGRVESISQTYYSNLTSSQPPGTGRERNFAFQEYGWFVQDNWRIRPNLTLNLGLRYELNTVPKELNGFQGVLDQASQITSSANISNFTVVPGDNWYGTDLKNFAPRAGFAWDIFGSGTMVLRGAYGIYHDRLIGGITSLVDQNSYGFSQTVSVFPNSAGTDLRLSDNIAFPAQPGLPALSPPDTRSTSVAILDPNLRTPRIDQYNLTLEKRLFGAVLEAGFVGTRGRNLFQYLNWNQTKTNGDFLQAFQELQAYRDMGTPVPASNTLVRIFGTPLAAFNALQGSNFDSGQAGIAADVLDRNYFDRYASAGVSDFYLRNFPQFNMFLFGTNSAQSWYNSLQLGIRKSTTYTHFRAYYTWSKSLDTASADGASYVSPSDSFNPVSDKAPSDFSRTHVLNLAWDYALPILRNIQSDSDIPKWLRLAFGGWNLGVLYIRESGARFSVSSGLQTQFAGVTSLANFTDNRNLGSILNSFGRIYWFDTDQASLFSFPNAGEGGTSGRNSFIGPGYRNLDLMLRKRFQIHENRFLQFRLEAYNVFNQVRFAIPETNLADPNFGIISATQGNPRLLQLALRYQF